MTYGGLILAAGASTRLRQPKQLLRIGTETLLDRSIRIAMEAGCAPVVVVLGAFENIIRERCALQGVRTLSHAGWADGMGTSLAQGVQAFTRVAGIVVMTCDMPSVTADHLRNLAESAKLTASYYCGRNGVPAYFPSNVFPELTKLRGDVGARDLLRSAKALALPGGEVDIDTPEDIAKAQATLDAPGTRQERR